MGWIKDNINSSAFGPSCSSAIGVIFMGCHSDFQGGFVQNNCITVAYIAEIYDFILAVENAIKLNWRNLWIEID